MNAYGFASGDRVNFGDPLGLCPSWLSTKSETDCDYDGDGKNSGSERAAHNSINAKNAASRAIWNALGLFNTIAEDPRGELTIGLLAGSIRSIPGKPFTGRNAAAEAFKHLEKYSGLDPHVAGNRLHALKRIGGLGAADEVAIGRTGDVYNAKTGERLGTLTDKSLGGYKR